VQNFNLSIGDFCKKINFENIAYHKGCEEEQQQLGHDGCGRRKVRSEVKSAAAAGAFYSRLKGDASDVRTPRRTMHPESGRR